MLSLPWWIEALAAFLGIISACLYARGWYITFIIALLNTLPFAYIFLQHAIYAQGIIHIYYSVMNVIGLILWYKADKQAQVKYRYLPKLKIVIHLLYVLAIFGLLLLLYKILGNEQQTPPNIQIWDTLSTSMAIIAMILGVKKVIDSWYYWLTYDIIMMILALQSGLYFASGQFALYFAIGIYGWLNWHRQYQNFSKKCF